MAIKLLDYYYCYCYSYLLLLILSLHFVCYSSGFNFSGTSEHPLPPPPPPPPHHHHHHHSRRLIPILSLHLKHFPNKYRLSVSVHPLSHFNFRVLLGISRFCMPRNPTPDNDLLLDKEFTPCSSSSNTTTSPLRKFLGYNNNSDDNNNNQIITKSFSTSANTFTFTPANTAVPLASLNPSGAPSASAPPFITVPSTNQVPYKAPPPPPPPPTDLGWTWCVARPDASETALKNALDYACGIGGADCTAIQYMRSCYNPNTVRAHASYAFNSYYQRYPAPSRCDFSSTAMLVNVNPSSSNCTYPSSSVLSHNPWERGEGSVGGLPELDSDYSGSTSVHGSDNPATSSSNCTANSATAAPLIFAFTLAYIWGRI